MKPSFEKLLTPFRLVSLGALACAGLALSVPSAQADISVNIGLEGPPPPRHEVIVETGRPGPDYVWVNGYWEGEPGHYRWAAGHWDRPPHRGAVWVAPRWDRDRDGHYHQVRGEWRDDHHDDRHDDRH